MGFVCSERTARALARAPLTVVVMGILLATAALRILISSDRDSLSDGVLMMKSMSPFLMRSRTFGRRPSASLKRMFTGTPAWAMARAVPSVAKTLKPSS